MKMKEFGPPGGGARPWRPPLDPPMYYSILRLPCVSPTDFKGMSSDYVSYYSCKWKKFVVTFHRAQMGGILHGLLDISLYGEIRQRHSFVNKVFPNLSVVVMDEKQKFNDLFLIGEPPLLG